MTSSCSFINATTLLFACRSIPPYSGIVISSCPRSRGCGPRWCILLRCHSLIPGVINPHGLTHDPMILLDAMDFQNRRIVHGAVDQRHWPKEGKDHGRCRRGRRAFIAGDVPLMIAEIEADLPLDNGVDE